jgi:hypothetical protein
MELWVDTVLISAFYETLQHVTGPQRFSRRRAASALQALLSSIAGLPPLARRSCHCVFARRPPLWPRASEVQQNTEVGIASSFHLAVPQACVIGLAVPPAAPGQSVPVNGVRQGLTGCSVNT